MGLAGTMYFNIFYLYIAVSIFVVDICYLGQSGHAGDTGEINRSYIIGKLRTFQNFPSKATGISITACIYIEHCVLNQHEVFT